MDYFKILGLKPRFEVDASALKKAYYRASRSTHPDHHGVDNDDVMLRSSQVNLAYKILRNKDSRVQYILEQEGLITEDKQLTVPQDFLMEMMDVNEALMDLQMDPDAALLEKVKTQITDIQEELSQSAQPAMLAYDAGDKSQLDAVLSYYLRSKYLSRIGQKLS
jgi:molecular chaperone HscB